MRKTRGFTLIEIVIVIIIIGVLASLGFVQYQRMIERSRGSEARSVMGGLRTNAAAYWIARSDITGNTVTVNTFVPTNLGMGSEVGQIPTACRATGSSPSYYFAYTITQRATNDGFTATATRCTANGKGPTGPLAETLTLTTNFADGTDVWSGSY